MKRYVPSLKDKVPISSGKDLYFYFDNPEHDGFDEHDHKLAAEWHYKIAKTSKDDQKNFHNVQAVLHDMAAHHKSVKEKTVPCCNIIKNLTPERKAFWDKEAKKIKDSNQLLKDLAPYRLTHMMSLTKSDTYELAVSQVADDHKPQPALQARNTKHPEAGVDSETMKEIRRQLYKRKHGQDAEPSEGYLSSPSNVPSGEKSLSDPRNQLPEGYDEKIKEVLANRRRY